MDRILKSLSYIFHPLFVPLMCVIFYFSKSPRYITPDIILAKVISLFILTIILPILFFTLLKTLGIVKSIHLESTNERILPLIINGAIILLVIRRVLPITAFIELYYFFIGVLISTMACLALAFVKFKVSIHMIAICSAFMYFIALSIHFGININNTLAFMGIIIGALASSRLLLKAHTNFELIMGAFVGIIPQLLTIPFWL